MDGTGQLTNRIKPPEGHALRALTQAGWAPHVPLCIWVSRPPSPSIPSPRSRVVAEQNTSHSSERTYLQTFRGVSPLFWTRGRPM